MPSLQELVKYSLRLEENVADLQKALELMLSVPHRANDNKFLASIEGYRGIVTDFDAEGFPLHVHGPFLHYEGI